MKLNKIFIVLLIGLFAFFFEFQNFIEYGFIRSPYIFKYFLIFILCVLSFKYLIQGFRDYRNSKVITQLYTFLTCFIILVIIYGHMYYRTVMDNSESACKAYGNKKIEGKEITEIDFKKNGYLLIHAGYKFTDDYFRGIYSKHGDTLILKIKINFKLPDKALIEDGRLKFIGDSTEYRLL